MRLVNITNVYCVMTSWYLVVRVDIVKRLEARCIKVSFKTELEMIIIHSGRRQLLVIPVGGVDEPPQTLCLRRADQDDSKPFKSQHH